MHSVGGEIKAVIIIYKNNLRARKMKKLFLCISIILLIVLLSCSAYASEIIYEKCFKNGTELVGTSYSDAPAVWNDQKWADYNAPVFTVADGCFAYDTAAVAGAPYPYNGTRVSYPRVNFTDGLLFPITSKQMDTSAYTFETEVKFSKSFARYDLMIRMGSYSWVSGVTADVSLFTISANGYLVFGDYRKQLELDTNYKISVLVDIVGNNRYKSLFVDSVCVSENQSMSVAGANAPEDKIKYIAYPSVRLYPHTSETAHSNKKWSELTCLMDNIKVYRGNPYAEEEVLVKSPYDIGLIPWDLSVCCSDVFTLSKETDGIRWKLSNKESGISIDKNTGELLYNADAVESDVTVMATRRGETLATKDFRLIRYGYFGENDAVGFKNAIVRNVDGENILSANGEAGGKITFSIDKEVFSGRMVIDAVLKAMENSSDSKLEVQNLQANQLICTTGGNVCEDWTRIKIIIDTVKNTYTVFADGEPISDIEAEILPEAGITEPQIPVRLIFSDCHIKLISVHRAPKNNPPQAFNVEINSLKAGSPASCTYDYFSESGYAESCTLTEWFVFDPAFGEYVSLGNSFTPDAGDEDRLFKVMVTPASDTLKGMGYMSEPRRLGDIYYASSGYRNNVAFANAVVTNNTHDILNAYIVAAEYSGSKLMTVKIEAFTAQIEETVRVGVRMEADGGDVKILLIDRESLKPLYNDALCLSHEN